MICTQEPSVLTDVRPSASTLSVRRVPDAAVWMDVANASVGALRDPSRPRRSPAYSPSSPAVRGSVAPWPSFADRLPIASRQYARRYELLFGRRLARAAPKPHFAPPPRSTRRQVPHTVHRVQPCVSSALHNTSTFSSVPSYPSYSRPRLYDLLRGAAVVAPPPLRQLTPRPPTQYSPTYDPRRLLYLSSAFPMLPHGRTDGAACAHGHRDDAHPHAGARPTVPPRPRRAAASLRGLPLLLRRSLRDGTPGAMSCCWERSRARRSAT